jgi:hypothetical protein
VGERLDRLRLMLWWAVLILLGVALLELIG